MYPIDNLTLDLFFKQRRQIVDISLDTVDGSYHLTEADIIQGSMVIDRYVISGDKIEIGSAISAELTMKLNNREGKFDDITLEGAEMFVRLGIEKENSTEETSVNYIPLGYFTIDESPRKLSIISITALDRMVQFDKPFKIDSITFPTELWRLLLSCCDMCEVTLGEQPGSLPNFNYRILEHPRGENLTCRQILQWIGEITATCAYIDWDGKLRMEWYSDTDTVIDKSLRYTSDMDEKDVTITGVQIEDDEENIYLAGTDEYALNIEGNALIQHDHNVIAHAVYEKVKGFSYRPYTCTTKALPHLYPLDKVVFIDKNGVSHNSIITHWVYKLNGRTTLTAKGVTSTKEGYAKANPLTAREAAILAKMQKANQIELDSRQQAALRFNEVIRNSLGLYTTNVKEGNGSIVYYYHNAATLEDSSVIYTFSEGGFAWTNDWNDGKPDWEYGINKDGNAILKTLSTYKISADYIDIDKILTVGNIATMDKIPTNMSDLVNDSDFQTKSGVTTIIGNTITTGYVEGLGCEFDRGKIGGWNIGTVPRAYINAPGSTNPSAFTNALYSTTFDSTNNSGVAGHTTIIRASSYKTDWAFLINSKNEKDEYEDIFGIKHNGYLYARNADIEGVLTAAAGSSIGDFTVTTDGNLSLNTTENYSKYMDVSKTYNSVTFNTRVSTGMIQLTRTNSTITNYITIDNATNSFPQLHFGYGGVYNGISFEQYNATYMLVAGSSSNFIIYDCGFGVYNDGYNLGVTCQIKIQTTTGDHVYMRIDKGVITGLSQGQYDTNIYPDMSSASI